MGATIDGYGCAGVSHVAYGLIARAVERVDSGYRSAMSVQVEPRDASDPCLWHRSSSAQKYLPKLATGEWVGCFGLTEPDAGSDPASMKTNAKQVPGGYLLNGAKMWITNSPISDLAIVWAKDEGGVIRGFIVERGDEGFLHTQDRRQDEPARLDHRRNRARRCVRAGRKYAAQCARDWAGHSAASTRRATALPGALWARQRIALHRARQYQLDRKQFGRPLAANQIPQLKMANMQTEIALGLQAALAVGRAIDAGTWSPEMVSLIKRNNCGKALDIARMARDMHGGNGISAEYHVIRHAINLETVNTYEGTHDVHALILGRAITGIQAFS